MTYLRKFETSRGPGVKIPYSREPWFDFYKTRGFNYKNEKLEFI
jgi:hypothetical protein